MFLEIGPADGGNGEVSLGLIVETGQGADVFDGFDPDAPDDEKYDQSSTDDHDEV